MKSISIVCIVLFFLFVNNVQAQELVPAVIGNRNSIRTGIGIGMNEGQDEIGMGFVYSFGFQKSYGEQERLRLNPNVIVGGFAPLVITDTRDQFYRISTFGFNVHYDLIKYKAISIVTTGGVFVNYSRGLLGTGGWPEENNNSSDYFLNLYYGGNASLALRIAPRKSKFAYELRPFNFQLGNNSFFMAYLMFGIDYKF